MLIDRRRMLGLSTLGAGLVSGTSARAAQALLAAPGPGSGPMPTPPQNIGPFYPVVRPGENMADLTRVPNQAVRARGELVEVRGTVRTVAGAPVRGAVVIAWQANASGAYNHPGSRFGTADPAFLGHAMLRTDRAGEFSLLTVRPGAYPDRPGTLRTPHIHFEVIGEEARLITQMYFPGERLNASDRLLQELQAGGGDPRSVMATTAAGPGRYGAARLSWTIIMDRS